VLGVLVLVFVAAAATAGAPAAAGQQQIRPKNRVRPHIAGTPQVGVALKAMPGAWTPSRSVVYRYRWLRCLGASAKCVRIARAAGRRYTPASRDLGTTLRVTVTAANAAGSGRATSRQTRRVREGKNERVVALWHMNETSGTVMDDSAGANNGTLRLVQIGLPGLHGTSYGFNGRNSYASVPSAGALNPGTANIILTLHLKTTAVPGLPPKDADLLRKGTYAPTTSEYKVELQHSGQASCGFQGSAGYGELIAGPRLNDGRWHTIQCIKAPTVIELVVDGKTFTQPANVGSISNTAPVVIGARPGGDWYAGSLDEVSIQIG
jgi:Concanavalin A-like lectin/glucanases superfamily